MKLIDLLVQELPKRGGWPKGAAAITQEPDGSVSLWKDTGARFVVGSWAHPSGISLIGYWCGEEALPVSANYNTAIVTRNEYESALAAAQPQWDGIGTPPVGCVCEYAKKSIPCNEWTECTVDYVGSAFIVYRDCYGVELTGIKGDINFRPIRSEADKKRDEIAKQINAAADASGTLGHVIYDAIAAGKINGLCIMY